MMILLGFTGFLRYDELSKIMYDDINFFNTYMKVFIEKSNTDIYRDGKWVTICKGNSEVCPVVNLKRYLELGKVKKKQYIFRGITKSKYSERLRKKNCPLSYTRAREIILQTCESIGLNKKQFGTHSLRSGGASMAANAGVPDRLFKRHGRWLTDRAKDMYVQDNVEELLTVTRMMCL